MRRNNTTPIVAATQMIKIVVKLKGVASQAPMPVAQQAPQKPPEKRLTRLEKLRLEQEERENAAKPARA